LTSRDFRSDAAGDQEVPSSALRWTITIGAPAVLTLAYPKAGLALLALVGLAPLFWLWSRSSWKDAARLGWISGVIFFFILFFWMTNSLGDYIGNWKLLAGVLLAMIEALAFAAVGALTSLACRGAFGGLSVVAAPAAWLLVESLRTRGSLGVPFGELGLTAAHMPWLLPMAAFGGAYGLTAILALVNGAIVGIAAGTVRGRKVGVLTLLALALLIAAGDFARARVSIAAPRTKIAIAQGNISQRDKWSPQIFEHTMTIYSDLTRKAALAGAKIVVWPETAITSYPLQDPALLAYLQRLASANGVWIVAGTVDKPGKLMLYNSVIDLSPSGMLIGRYDKHILVPFAEYLPLDRYLRGVPPFDAASQFIPGPGPTLLTAAGMRFGVLVCFESAFAPYAREVSNAGADALIIVTDDAWFGDTSGPYQHADMAVVDAVETGRWVVRGGDTGISAIIDPKGTVVARLALDNLGIVEGSIGPPVDTPYLHLGALWFLILALAALVTALLPSSGGSYGWRSRRGRA
jgi:apolipoprotein N-acyltransferase